MTVEILYPCLLFLSLLSEAEVTPGRPPLRLSNREDACFGSLPPRSQDHQCQQNTREEICTRIPSETKQREGRGQNCARPHA